HGISGRAPGRRVVGFDVGLEVVADLDEARVGSRLEYPLVTVLAIKVLHVEIQAPIAEKLTAPGTHLVRHVGLVERAEKLGDFRPRLRLHLADYERAAHCAYSFAANFGCRTLVVSQTSADVDRLRCHGRGHVGNQVTDKTSHFLRGGVAAER